MHPAKLSTSLLVVLAMLASVGPLGAETVNCTPITSWPAVINVQGVYCFTGDLTTNMASGSAIQIDTNNVVLDLNGFKLGNLSAGPGTTANGILAVNRQNITVKNGTIRGFFNGIFISNTGASQGHIVEDIRADQNLARGLQVQGSYSIVRNNLVVSTGGSTDLGPNASAFGIFVVGTGVRVLNNDVTNTFKQGVGIAIGINFGEATGGLAVNNRITEADTGIQFDASTGKYRDNLTFGVTTPYSGGTNVGNNF